MSSKKLWHHGTVVASSLTSNDNKVVGSNPTAVEEGIINAFHNPEFIKSKSAAAAGLCSWVINIVKFFDVYCDVEPKRRALDEANAELLAARQKLTAVKNKVIKLQLNRDCKRPLPTPFSLFYVQKKII